MWINLMTKLIFYRSKLLKDSPVAAAALVIGLAVMVLMSVAMDRIDLLLGLGMGLV